MTRPLKLSFKDADTNRRCRICGKPLKWNLLLKKPNADLCYKCFKETVIDVRAGHHGEGREHTRKEREEHEHTNKYANRRGR